MSPPTQAPKLLLIAAFAAIYLLWGGSYLAIRIGVETMPPFLMAGARFLAAGAPLYAILRLCGAQRPSLAHWGSALALGGLMLAGGNGLVTWAEQTVPSGIAAIIIATVPLWMTTLDAWPLRRTRLTGWSVLGLVLGIVGIAVLVAPSANLERIDPVGAIVLLAAALSWSAGSLLTRTLRAPSSPLLLASMQMTCGGAVLLVWGTLGGEWARLDVGAISARSAWAWVYLVTMATIIALWAYVWLMRVSSAAAVSTYAFVNPIVAVLLGWAFAGEHVGPRVILSTALVVGAVVFLHAARTARSVPPGRPPESVQPASASPAPRFSEGR